MKLVLALGIVAVQLVGISGCAITAIKPPISEATVLVGDVSAYPAGRNFRISSMAEDSGRRFSIATYATSCDDRSGDLFLNGSSGQYLPSVKVFIGGSRPEDKIFGAMCSRGLKIVDRLQANGPASVGNRDGAMSPEARSILLQHLLNNALPPQSPTVETRCEKVRNSTTGEIVCRTN